VAAKRGEAKPTLLKRRRKPPFFCARVDRALCANSKGRVRIANFGKTKVKPRNNPLAVDRAEKYRAASTWRGGAYATFPFQC